MEQILGLVALASGLIIGLGAIGACMGYRYHGFEVPRSFGSSA